MTHWNYTIANSEFAALNHYGVSLHVVYILFTDLMH